MNIDLDSVFNHLDRLSLESAAPAGMQALRRLPYGRLACERLACELAVATQEDTFPELDPLLRDALAWVIRLHSGAATAEDGEAVQQWRLTSPQHEDAFRQAVKLWRTFGEGIRTIEASPPATVDFKRTSSARHLFVSRRGLLGLAAAASAAGYFVVNPPLNLWPSLKELSADYRTSKGEQRDIVLSQDVSVKLNTETSIAVRDVKGEPQIELISGEAAVTAARSEGKPLIILAEGGRVTAVQASFNARCLDGVVSVACIDGTVDIEWKDRTVQLSRDQQVSYSVAGGLGAPVVADLVQTTAWEQGLLIVHNQSLASVVEEINRYHYGKIIVVNTSLGRRMITGTFHIDRLDDFMRQVNGLFGGTAHYLPGGIVLLS